MKKISLKFESESILKILGVQLYDSPLAMLRENVQNAFDAIMERLEMEPDFKDPQVSITITDEYVRVVDNGIGMDAINLQENFWTAGKSGKNTEAAKRAGVVGHFGIGALANFGVCSRLDVDTHKVGCQTRYHSYVNKEEINGENIVIEDSQDSTSNYGTCITATLEPNKKIDVVSAIAYLSPFVQYLEIPVLLNDKLLSKNAHGIVNIPEGWINIKDTYKSDLISFSYAIAFTTSSATGAKISITDVQISGKQYKGELFLTKDVNRQNIMGLHNWFGLSNMALNSYFSFAGYANFDFLQPTAGREAVSRDSISIVQTVLSAAEKVWAKVVAETPLSDHYRDFLFYVRNNFNSGLADNIKIACDNIETEDIKLMDAIKLPKVKYYKGQDRTIIESYKTSAKPLLRVSAETPRRQIQLNYLQCHNISELDDSVQVLRTYDKSDLDWDEYVIADDIKKVIEDDYILTNFSISLSDISHGVQTLVKKEGQYDFTIFLSRDNQEIKNLIKVYNSDDYALYKALVKDYVRTSLYIQFSDYIPKDKKTRAAYIDAAYNNRKEELTIYKSEVSDAATLFRKLQSNEISASEFISQLKDVQKELQPQTFTPQQVDDVEKVVKSAGSAVSVQQQDVLASEFTPQPPILELDNDTDKKILQTTLQSPVLHNHQMFVCLTDKMNRDFRSFLMLPHYTKVIWSTHRIIYIFIDNTGKMSLYYEMELSKKLADQYTGGTTLISTTIITKKRMFVPIPRELMEYFQMKDSMELRFMVHYDKVSG